MRLSPPMIVGIFAFAALVLSTVLAPSCCSSELKSQAQLSEARAAAFIQLMETDQTDRQTEQDFIRACGEMFSAIREASGMEPIGGAR